MLNDNEKTPKLGRRSRSLSESEAPSNPSSLKRTIQDAPTFQMKNTHVAFSFQENDSPFLKSNENNRS